MSADASDLSLVRRVQHGDKGAFDALVLKYQHKLVKLVMRYVRNPAEAEDIAQEAFIKAYRALPQFRGDSAFYTWLYRIAINTAKNAVVSRDRSPIEYELDRSNEESYDMQSRMKDAETPEGLVLTDEIRSTVNAAIDALPEDLRTAIVLRELEGLSYEEIAAAMACPVGTVRSRIFRAREAIGRRLRSVAAGAGPALRGDPERAADRPHHGPRDRGRDRPRSGRELRGAARARGASGDRAEHDARELRRGAQHGVLARRTAQSAVGLHDERVGQRRERVDHRRRGTARCSGQHSVTSTSPRWRSPGRPRGWRWPRSKRRRVGSSA